MIRPPIANGTFYPNNPTTLKKAIETYLSKVKHATKQSIKDPFAFIVPHAGYTFSGFTAAYVYSLLQNIDVDTFLLLGPTHNAYVDSNSLFTEGAYKTPLGLIDLDDEIIDFLRSKEHLKSSIEAHLTEHSLEVQLPFLQIVKPKAKIVPFLIGDYSVSNLEYMANILNEIFNNFSKKIIVLASSDLSHYHTAEVATKKDKLLIQLLKEKNFEKLIEHFNDNKIEACGAGPILTTMFAARTLNKNNITILNYSHSGQVNHDNSRVVGYLAAAIH